MSRIRGGLCVVGAVVILALPASAPAAQVIGQTGTGTTCAADSSWVQTTLSSGASYSPSAYGVITSWSAAGGGPEAGKTLKLLVLMPNPSAGPTHFIATQKDTMPRQLNLVGGQLNSFAVRIPIQSTERIAIYVPTPQVGGPAVHCVSGGHGGGNNVQGVFGEPPLNTSVNFNSPNGGFRLNASAVVEPDTDRDVFGDETQDNCIGSAGQVGGCPNTLTLGKPKAKGNKVTVAATLPGAGTLVAGSATDKTLAGAAAKKKKARPPLKQASQTLTAKATQTVTLTLRLSKTGKAKLRRKGKLGLSIKALYTPIGGTAGSATATAKLRRKKKG